MFACHVAPLLDKLPFSINKTIVLINILGKILQFFLFLHFLSHMQQTAFKLFHISSASSSEPSLLFNTLYLDFTSEFKVAVIS